MESHNGYPNYASLLAQIAAETDSTAKQAFI